MQCALCTDLDVLMTAEQPVWVNNTCTCGLQHVVPRKITAVIAYFRVPC